MIRGKSVAEARGKYKIAEKVKDTNVKLFNFSQP